MKLCETKVGRADSFKEHAYYDVHALTKCGAKRKVFKLVCQKDTGYLLTAGLAPKLCPAWEQDEEETDYE